MNEKSIVVFNTPTKCNDCYFKGHRFCVCNLVDEDIDEYVDPNETKPDWCPLRPLPRRMSMRDEAEFYLGYMNGKTKYLGFNEGYNACLEDILGGE